MKENKLELVAASPDISNPVPVKGKKKSFVEWIGLYFEEGKDVITETMRV